MAGEFHSAKNTCRNSFTECCITKRSRRGKFRGRLLCHMCELYQVIFPVSRFERSFFPGFGTICQVFITSLHFLQYFFQNHRVKSLQDNFFICSCFPASENHFISFSFYGYRQFYFTACVILNEDKFCISAFSCGHLYTFR